MGNVTASLRRWPLIDSRRCASRSSLRGDDSKATELGRT